MTEKQGRAHRNNERKIVQTQAIEDEANLVEAEVLSIIAEATTANHHVPLADETLAGTANAATRHDKRKILHGS